jgi:hypothetical protein
MKESFKYPQGRIARIVEREAGKKFGPENLTKDVVAQALHISPEQLSDEEWEEISEFAVNAGSALLRSSLGKSEGSISTEEEYKSERARVKESARGLIPFHDIFHAAETYRLTHGRSASAEFAEADTRARYTEPSSAAAELYPILFLIIPPNLDEPFPILLSHQEGREAIAGFLYESFEDPLPGVRKMIEVLETSDQSPDPDARKKEFETLVELIILSNAIKNLQEATPAQAPLTESEAKAIQEAIQRAAQYPTSHYYQFAQKVFAETNDHDPRLFIDEFLSCIRTGGESVALSR